MLIFNKGFLKNRVGKNRVGKMIFSDELKLFKKCLSCECYLKQI